MQNSKIHKMAEENVKPKSEQTLETRTMPSKRN